MKKLPDYDIQPLKKWTKESEMETNGKKMGDEQYISLIGKQFSPFILQFHFWLALAQVKLVETLYSKK